MTTQKTPLKTKAFSTFDITELNFGSEHDNDLLVWLSDAEAEIQQLKAQIKEIFKTYNEFSKLSATIIFDLEKQIETAKPRFLAFLDGIDYPQEKRQKLIDLVFGETETPDNYSEDCDQYAERYIRKAIRKALLKEKIET